MQFLEFLILTLVAGLLANVSALPVGFAEKRAIVTVVQTVTAPPTAPTIAAVPTIAAIVNTPIAAAPVAATTPVIAPVAATTPVIAPVAATTPVIAPVAATTPVATAVAANTPAVAAAAAPATTSKSSGALSFFANLFGDIKADDSKSTAAQVATPAATAVASPAAAAVAAASPAAAATTATSSSKGLFSSLLGDLSSIFGFGDSSSSSTAATTAGTTTATTAGTAAVAAAPLLASSAAPVAGSSTSSTGSLAAWYSLSSGQSVPTLATVGNYDSQYAVGAKGITYSPYQKSGACKTAQMVASDIAKLGSFSIIRLYATDCNGIQNVLAAMTSSQKLFLGIWNIDSGSVTSGLQAIQSAVATSSRGWNAVDTISIGNEQVNDGTATVAQIQSALSTARSWIQQNPGYTGPVVSVDTLVAVMNNPGLCTASDYLAVNCHPFFTGSIQPSDSGSWLQSQISALQGVCGNSKKVVITETGWPTRGNSIGTCVPSQANQQAALSSIMSTLGSQVFAFTMYNDYWKAPGPYDVEQSWGIFGDPQY